MSSTFIIHQNKHLTMSLACLHFTTPHSVPTPTVCGHAEACPSTTYANYFLYLHPIAVAARWRGCLMPLKKSRARVGSCASSRSETSIFRSNTFGSYLFIEPYELNRFLHVALESGYKNFFLLTVCPEIVVC